MLLLGGATVLRRGGEREMPMSKILRFEDGSPRCFRLLRRAGEPYHYATAYYRISYSPGPHALRTACGIHDSPAAHRDGCFDHDTDGKPLRICGHCRKYREREEKAK